MNRYTTPKPALRWGLASTSTVGVVLWPLPSGAAPDDGLPDVSTPITVTRIAVGAPGGNAASSPAPAPADDDGALTDVALPVTVSSSAASVSATAAATSPSPAPASSPSVAAINAAVQVGGNSVAVAGDSSVETAAAASWAPAAEPSLADVAAPVTVYGNSVGAPGAVRSACTTATDPARPTNPGRVVDPAFRQARRDINGRLVEDLSRPLRPVVDRWTVRPRAR